MRWVVLALGVLLAARYIFWPTALVVSTVRNGESFTPTFAWNLLVQYLVGASFLAFGITADLWFVGGAAAVMAVAYVAARLDPR
jgi:hypothetical protein